MTTTPKRVNVSDIGYQNEAVVAFMKDGAVILTNVHPEDGQSWKDRATEIPFLFMSPENFLLSQHQAAGVHLEHDGHSGLKGRPLFPHSDGYVWGDCYPDLVILLCEQESQGGENYLVDGERVVARMDPKIVDLLQTVDVDHTERIDTGMAAGAESVVPVLRRIERGDCIESWRSDWKRLCWRRMVSMDVALGETPVHEDSYISLWKSLGDKQVDEALLYLDQAILKEDLMSERFQLLPGEALIIDNFRMLHAREAYAESTQERRIWRVWSWSRGSNGLPPNMEGKAMPASVVEAEKAMALQ